MRAAPDPLEPRETTAMQSEVGSADFEARAVLPFREMGACEALWSQPGTTFRSLAARFARRHGGTRRLR